MSITLAANMSKLALFDFEGLPDQSPLNKSGSIATVQVNGLISRGTFFGANTNRLLESVDEIRQDPTIKGAIFVLNSPGGDVRGLGDLCKQVSNLAAEKTTVSFVQDLCCSAAYRIACCTSSITASPESEIGSIGTFCLLEDDSEFFKKMGVKIHLISSGESKGTASMGQKVTKEMIEVEQAKVDEINQFFLDDVSLGRGMSLDDVKKLATGETFFAKESQEKGLIDQVSFFPEFMTNFSNLFAKEKSSSINRLKILKLKSSLVCK